jgi:hypothetical protein
VTSPAHRPHVTSAEPCPLLHCPLHAGHPGAHTTLAEDEPQRYPAIHDELCEVLGITVGNASREQIVDRVRALIGSRTNPTDPFDRVVEEIINLNRSKRADYTGDRGPWANFEDTASQTGTTPGHVVEVMIANKQSRLRSLSGTDRTPNHEAVRDTKLDRAVYAIIALALDDEATDG